MTLYLTLTPEGAALLVRDLEARERSAGQSPLRQAVLADLRGLVELSRPVACPGCGGSGRSADMARYCRGCDGTGEGPTMPRGPLWMPNIRPVMPPMTGEGI